MNNDIIFHTYDIESMLNCKNMFLHYKNYFSVYHLKQQKMQVDMHF